MKLHAGQKVVNCPVDKSKEVNFSNEDQLVNIVNF